MKSPWSAEVKVTSIDMIQVCIVALILTLLGLLPLLTALLSIGPSSNKLFRFVRLKTTNRLSWSSLSNRPSYKQDFSNNRRSSMTTTRPILRDSPFIANLNDLTQEKLNFYLRSIPTRRDLFLFWRKLNSQSFSSSIMMSSSMVHQLIRRALELNDPSLAVTIFERFYNFPYSEQYRGAMKLSVNHQVSPAGTSPAKTLLPNHIYPTQQIIVNQVNMSTSIGTEVLKPHPHVVTTIIKAYGRLKKPDLARAAVDWFESAHDSQADVYMMSALLYVMSTSRRLHEAETIFWEEMPARRLNYNIVTANSLMYLYARSKKPQDALKVYDMIKQQGLQCTIVTYGILVKALMLSGNPTLHQLAKEVVLSLPSMNLQPTIELFNQMIEYYVATNQMEEIPEVQRIMQQCQPPVALNSISYGHLIYGYASDRKPHTALALFQRVRELQRAQLLRQEKQKQDRLLLQYQEKDTNNKSISNKRYKNNQANHEEVQEPRLAPNEFAYMGVLKAFAALRDGVSAVRVLSEMMEQQVRIDQNHVATALFACVIANQFTVAEALLSTYLQYTKEIPDIVICNLLLRMYWQQGKYPEGYRLLEQMQSRSKGYPLPSLSTFRDLLRQQIVEERFSEAESTFATLLAFYSYRLQNLQLPSGTMTDGFETLSYALGCHSATMTREFHADQQFGRGWFYALTVQQALLKRQQEHQAPVPNRNTKHNSTNSPEKQEKSIKMLPNQLSILLQSEELLRMVQSRNFSNNNSEKDKVPWFAVESVEYLPSRAFLPARTPLLADKNSTMINTSMKDHMNHSVDHSSQNIFTDGDYHQITMKSVDMVDEEGTSNDQFDNHKHQSLVASKNQQQFAANLQQFLVDTFSNVSTQTMMINESITADTALLLNNADANSTTTVNSTENKVAKKASVLSAPKKTSGSSGSSSSSSNAGGLEVLPKPSTNALKFILRMIYLTSMYENVQIPSSIYCEIVRALLLEEEWSACSMLIQWREEKKIKVKLPEQPDNVYAAEAVAKDTIAQGLLYLQSSSAK